MLTSIFLTLLGVGLVFLIIALIFKDVVFGVVAGITFILLGGIVMVEGVDITTGKNISQMTTSSIDVNNITTLNMTGIETQTTQQYKNNILGLILLFFGAYTIWLGVIEANKQAEN